MHTHFYILFGTGNIRFCA